MPQMTGLDVLAWIRLQPELTQLPAVIWTTSNHPRDRERAAELGARDYLVKPSTFEALMTQAQQFFPEWIGKIPIL
jgi:CheY-like chemotaxis protein